MGRESFQWREREVLVEKGRFQWREGGFNGKRKRVRDYLKRKRKKLYKPQS